MNHDDEYVIYTPGRGFVYESEDHAGGFSEDYAIDEYTLLLNKEAALREADPNDFVLKIVRAPIKP